MNCGGDGEKGDEGEDGDDDLDWLLGATLCQAVAKRAESAEAGTSAGYCWVISKVSR